MGNKGPAAPRRIICLLSLFFLVAGSNIMDSTGIAGAVPSCAEGSTPKERADLSTVILPTDMPQGAQMLLSRIT